MKIFSSEEFIRRLKWLVNEVPTVYYSGKNWSKLNSKGYWQFDCVVSIKSILWQFKADKKLDRGGTIYKYNGVADFTCNGGLDHCTDVSKDFTNLVAGEYLCMKDTRYNHSGIYLGNGKVFECTTAWKTKKCIISDIGKDGTRTLNGVKNLKWTYHGKLEYINYEETPKEKYKIGDFVKINGVYKSSTSDVMLKPLIDHGKITRIVEGRNPYLLNEGKIGWVNNECITGRYDEEGLLILVRKTLNGDFGNGEERKRRLGGRYQEVQNQVNLNIKHGTTSWDKVRIY